MNQRANVKHSKRVNEEHVDIHSSDNVIASSGDGFKELELVSENDTLSDYLLSAFIIRL